MFLEEKSTTTTTTTHNFSLRRFHCSDERPFICDETSNECFKYADQLVEISVYSQQDLLPTQLPLLSTFVRLRRQTSNSARTQYLNCRHWRRRQGDNGEDVGYGKDKLLADSYVPCISYQKKGRCWPPRELSFNF